MKDDGTPETLDERVQDFIKWLQDNPDVVKKGRGDKQHLRELCLRGYMEALYRHGLRDGEATWVKQLIGAVQLEREACLKIGDRLQNLGCHDANWFEGVTAYMDAIRARSSAPTEGGNNE